MTSAHPLDDLLRALRSEIDALDSGDVEARQRLDGLMAELGTRAGDPPDASADAGLAGQLEAAILSFEATHPRIAGVMNDALEKLGTMGI